MTYDIAPYDDGIYTHNAFRTVSAWGHGTVRTTHLLVFAQCLECGWIGPDRTGDPNALRLVEDDACWHFHQRDTRCGLCEACLPDGALRHG